MQMKTLPVHDAPTKILVIDDNPQNLRLLYSLLSKEEYDVRPVTSAEQALLTIKKSSPPDLILLDIKMPEMNGFQLCEQLKSNEKTRKIPIIFISAMNHIDDIIRGFSLGGVDYITKPFQEEEVLARVNTQVALRNQQATLEIKNAALESEIARRKQIEKELRLAKEAADRANQSKSIFLSNISHELRTPLNSIIGFAHLLVKDKLLNESQRESSQIIVRSGHSLLSLINEILDIEKIEAGKFVLFQKDICLTHLLNDIIASMKIIASEKNIDLILEMDDQLPSHIYADPNRLSQVLINFVSNAIKFTEKGAVRLRVFTFRPCEKLLTDFTTIVHPSQKVHPQQERIGFEIIDTGIGIHRKDHDIIFQPFEQTGENKYRLQGTGLGLHICKKWIEKMNGRLHLFSQAGKGSTFLFDLEIHSNEQVSEDDHNCIPMNDKNNANDGSVRTILIVDDTPANYQLITLMLKPHNVKSIIAETGLEALELLKQHNPDIILLDMMMPQMDGAETIKRIRLMPSLSQTPVIAVSSVIGKHNFDHYRKMGFTDLLVKPISLNDLNACLKKYL